MEITSAQGLAWISGRSLIFGPQDCVHKNSLHVLFVDGSVHGVPRPAVERLMPLIGTPNGGEVVDLDF